MIVRSGAKSLELWNCAYAHKTRARTGVVRVKLALPEHPDYRNAVAVAYQSKVEYDHVASLSCPSQALNYTSARRESIVMESRARKPPSA